MRRRSAALWAAVALACAFSPGYTKAPGSSPDRTLYTVETLSFEAPSGFREGSVPFFDFLLSPPADRRGGGTHGLTLSFCTARDQESCGVLGVRRGSDLGARCADADSMREVFRVPDGKALDLTPVRYADRPGWLAGGSLDPDGYSRTLILCDGDRYWWVRSMSTGGRGVAPAKFAFELFLRTARSDPAARPPPANGPQGRGAPPASVK